MKRKYPNDKLFAGTFTPAEEEARRALNAKRVEAETRRDRAVSALARGKDDLENAQEAAEQQRMAYLLALKEVLQARQRQKETAAAQTEAAQTQQQAAQGQQEAAQAQTEAAQAQTEAAKAAQEPPPALPADPAAAAALRDRGLINRETPAVAPNAPAAAPPPKPPAPPPASASQPAKIANNQTYEVSKFLNPNRHQPTMFEQAMIDGIYGIKDNTKPSPNVGRPVMQG